MGSTSDWDVMQHCVQTLEQLGIGCERRALSAHRTPHLAIEWISGAQARGLKVIIAAAGGAAHLAGVAAAVTPLPVLGVPMESASLKGLDSLLSMVQMPGGDSRGDAGHRQTGRGQRRALCRGDSRAQPSGD